MVTVYEATETELEKEGYSFEELPRLFGNNHREFVVQALALVYYHTLRAQDAQIQHVSSVEDLHRYSVRAMELMGKAEEVQIWDCLLVIL